VFIVTSANQDFNLARLERYYVIARESGAKICFVLSKIDLTSDYERLAGIIAERFPECGIEKTSIYDYAKENFPLFNHWNPGETAVFFGSSGVGKSSLINLMLENEVIKTREIREYDGRGRHTTTVRHLYILQDKRIVIDNPGLRGIGISAKADSIEELFPEIKEMEEQCRFNNCSHISEPGCAIQKALENGELDYDRYLRYLKLKGDGEKKAIITQGKTYQKEQLTKEAKKKQDFLKNRGTGIV
jgi:ribosome biogenesis GTPase